MGWLAELRGDGYGEGVRGGRAGRHTPLLELGSREEAQAFMLLRGGRLERAGIREGDVEGEGGGWREV